MLGMNVNLDNSSPNSGSAIRFQFLPIPNVKPINATHELDARTHFLLALLCLRPARCEEEAEYSTRFSCHTLRFSDLMSIY